MHRNEHTDLSRRSRGLDATSTRRLRRKLHHIQQHRARRGEHRRGGDMYDHDHIHFGPDSRGGRGHGGHRGRGGRHRARRGAIVEAVLVLLDERPMHGYELITELEARSEGRWRPSPGTMYPALNRMEARGLLVSEEVDSKKQFSLSDAGRERLDDYLADRDDDAPAPWNEHASGGRGDLRRRVGEIMGQARQIGRFGTPEQIDAALVVFDDTRRRLYEILAAGPTSESPAGDAPAETADADDDT